jgi:biotin-dependent carboxylase-like uncharacterized protein
VTGSSELVVRDAGLLTTVQDGGRPGLAHLGVPPSGAVDAAALRRANRLVGNPPYATALEATLLGPELAVVGGAVVAVTGGRCAVTADGLPLPLDTAVGVQSGAVLRVGPVGPGLRCYVAVRGGLAVPRVLGSRSTCTLSGLGPPPLTAGDRLPVGDEVVAAVSDLPDPSPSYGDTARLRVLLGPRDDALTTAGLRTLLRATWTVTPRSDRTGLRLAGPRVQRAGSAELPSEGLVPGSVQVPPDGQPVLFLAGAPTTGGYPVVAVVRDRDLHLAAQAAPGTSLRLTAT